MKTYIFNFGFNGILAYTLMTHQQYYFGVLMTDKYSITTWLFRALIARVNCD